MAVLGRFPRIVIGSFRRERGIVSGYSPLSNNPYTSEQQRTREKLYDGTEGSCCCGVVPLPPGADCRLVWKQANVLVLGMRL